MFEFTFPPDAECKWQDEDHNNKWFKVLRVTNTGRVALRAEVDSLDDLDLPIETVVYGPTIDRPGGGNDCASVLFRLERFRGVWMADEQEWRIMATYKWADGYQAAAGSIGKK